MTPVSEDEVMKFDANAGDTQEPNSSNNERKDDNDTNTKENEDNLDPCQKLGLLMLLVFTILGCVIIVLVTLIPFDGSRNSSNDSAFSSSSSTQEGISGQSSSSTASVVTTMAPSSSVTAGDTPPLPTTTTSSSISDSTTVSPTVASTIPVMGCRGDRFDNEGNIELNNRLYAGQYVCSDDGDQRYRFGIDPDSGYNLVMKDLYNLDPVRTYYFNDKHTNEYQQRQRYLRQQRNMQELNHTDTAYDINNDLAANTANDCDNIEVEQDDMNETLATTLCREQMNNTIDTYLDYYFSISTEAAFRIHRIQRTASYEILNEELHWELPSIYNVTIVYQNCLKTHDCPYCHLHRDGVMVLAWLDFSLAYDGWMEKNIRSCYNFNTTDQL